ncbi:MAG TPA: hypothetical protein V6D33_13375, partial [Cyanophyceae cyanobacterium]
FVGSGMNTQEDVLLLDESLILGAKKKLRQVITCQQIELIFDEYQTLLDALDESGNLYRELRTEIQKDEELNAYLLIVRVANGLISTADYHQEEIAAIKKAEVESAKRQEEIKALQSRPATEEIKARLDKLNYQESKTLKEVEISWAEVAWKRHHTEFPSVVQQALQHLRIHNYPIWSQLQTLKDVCENSKRVNGVYKTDGED